MEISIKYWTYKTILVSFITAFCLSFPVFFVTSILLGGSFGFFTFTFPWAAYISLLLALIVGILTTLFVATTWVNTKFIVILDLLGMIPVFLVSSYSYSPFSLLVSGTLTVIGLAFIFITSKLCSIFADKDRINLLESILRSSLVSKQTIDLSKIEWLSKEKHDFIRYLWKYKILRAASARIGYQISSSQQLEPIPIS